jgi:hypothetical protein
MRALGNSLAIGTEENSEIVGSTYLSPNLKFAYGIFLRFFLSTLLSLLNITLELWGDDFGCSNG